MNPKNLLLLAAAYTAMACNAQSGVNVSGTVNGASKVYLLDATMTPIDSTDVKDGKFSFVLDPKTTPDMRHVSSSLSRDALVSQFVLDSEDVVINLDSDTRSGSKLNNALNEGILRINEAVSNYREIVTAYQHAFSEAERQVLVDKANAAGEKVEEAMKQCYTANPDNIIGVYMLATNLYQMMDYNELETALSKAGAYKDSPMLKAAKRTLQAQAKRHPGLMFTDLRMQDPQGKDRSLSEWCGKGGYVLVDFWASWCGPCRQEMPNVVACYKKYHDRGFEVVGVSFDQNHDAWVKAIEQLGLTWPHISDLKYWECAAAEAYGINSIPSNILVGPDGKIVAADLRGPALDAKLSEIYK